MKRIVPFVGIMLFLLLVPASATRAQEAFFQPAIQDKDVDSTLRTDWYGTYLQNKKIGYFQARRFRAADTIVDDDAMNMKLVSFNKKVEIRFSQTLTFEGKAPYRLMHGVMEQADGATTMKIVATRQNKGFEYTVLASGQKQSRQVADVDYSLADAMALEMWLRTRPKIGSQVATKDLDFKDWKISPIKSTLKAIKTSLVSGVEVKYSEVDNEQREGAFLSRHDSEGRLLSGNIAIFELRKEAETEAKNTEFSQDIFILGMTKLDRPIGSTIQLTDLVLKVVGKEGSVFEDGPRQSVATDKDGDLILKVGKKYAHQKKLTEKEIADNLEETSAYAITNPKVQALTKEAIGDAKTPEEKVRRIVSFVHKYIQPHLTANFPNIHDLLEKKKGDCKCYALMTVNLCRAAGIPARETNGLLYMGDDAKAFGGHAWNEVVLNGVWVPVDASLDEVEVDAGHLCLGNEKSTGNLLKSLGKLSFKVVESRTK